MPVLIKREYRVCRGGECDARSIWRIHTLGGCVPDHFRAVHSFGAICSDNLLYNDLLSIRRRQLCIRFIRLHVG